MNKISIYIDTLKGLKLSVYSVFFFVVVFRILLDLLFIGYLEPIYGYMKFRTNIDLLSYIFSHLGLVVCFFTLKKSSDDIDKIVWFFFYLVVYVPLSSYYGMTSSSIYWFSAVTTFWVICNLFLNSRLLNFKFSLPTVGLDSIRKLFLLSAVTLIIILVVNLDLNYNMSLTDVYEIRKSNPTSFLPFSEYLINVLSKVMAPLIILYSLHKLISYKTLSSRFKNLLYIFVSVIFMFIIFFSTGHKGILFNLPFVIGLYFLFLIKDRYSSLAFVLTLTLSTLSVFALFSDNSLFLSLIYRRTLMITAQLSFFYHDFFQGEPIYLSNSILSDFSTYPFEKEPSYEVAAYYFNKGEMAASNGLLSDGFRHFGYLGLFLWMFGFVVLLRILKGFTANVAFPVVLTMAILFAKTVMDGPILTTLLTHGFLFMFLIFLISKKSSAS